jgi:hypothetical protein
VSASAAPAAGVNVDDDEWQDPELLEKLAATAQQLALPAGARRSITIA